MGRTPIIGHVIREFLPRAEILNYLDAILRTYNRFGRRDNKWKARIKILVKERTPRSSRATSTMNGRICKAASRPCPMRSSQGSTRISPCRRIEAFAGDDSGHKAAVADNRAFGNWVKRNVHAHKVPGYAIVTLSLKRPACRPVT